MSDADKITQATYDKEHTEGRKIIAERPSLKTASLDRVVNSVSYILNNLNNIRNYYDENQQYVKRKFIRYRKKKQKAMTELCKRLLNDSDKYGRKRNNIGSSSEKKWKRLEPRDKVEDVENKSERDIPIVIAYGAAQFENLRSNVSAPAKRFCQVQSQFVKERNKKLPTFLVSVDEHLTSQVCPKCKTLTEYDVDTSGAEIYLVLKCTLCNTRFNRDHMTAINIRSVFIYMGNNNNKRLLTFDKSREGR